MPTSDISQLSSVCLDHAHQCHEVLHIIHDSDVVSLDEDLYSVFCTFECERALLVGVKAAAIALNDQQ